MIEVIQAGLCDLVMDLGRPGWGALGVSAGGAADTAALAAANRLVGNEAGAAGLEIVLSGPTLRFPAGGVVACTGARFCAQRAGGAALAWNETLVLAPGEQVSLGRAQTGCRAWLAVRGGLRVPPVLGSRSTFLPAGFGGYEGRPLRAGDVLATGETEATPRRLRTRPPAIEDAAPLRVIAGPQLGLLDDAGLAAFFGSRYRVAVAADRRGVRLGGQALAHARVEQPSQGVLPGAIQLPPDGQPIILGWDGPVTGGYPLIAAVIAADLPRLAQLKPGDRVGFATISAAAARALSGEWEIEAWE